MKHYQPDCGETMSSLELLITRAAQENIPIKVISRIFGYSERKLTQYLKNEVDEGRLLNIPQDDWPHLCGISQSLPSVEMIRYGHDDADVADACHEFKLTAAQSCLLMCLVKRAGKFCNKELLIRAIARKPEDIICNIVETRVCHVRKIMKQFGVRIITKNGCGYMMTASAAQIVISRIAARREINMDRPA